MGKPDLVGDVGGRWQQGRLGAVVWSVLAAGWVLAALNLALAGDVGEAALRAIPASCAAVLAIGVARQRVWSDGVALYRREYRTRRVAWAEVADVYLHKGLLHDGVRLRTHDGQVVKLPPGLELTAVQRWRSAVAGT